MKRIATFSAGLFIGLFLIGAVYSQDPSLSQEAGGLREAGSPRLIGRSILFSYQFPEPAREGQLHTVQAALEHESYSRLHPFGLNDNGVYILIVATPPDVSTLRYRLVVDGVWTVDPRAPSEITDRWGIRISEFQVPIAGAAKLEYPAVSPEGLVEFRILAESGQSVALVGSFNGWDPFMTPMAETQPGLYSRIVRLTEGEHLYYFMVDGLRIPDPNNASQRWNVAGMVVSVVQLP
ncbi:MAG: hypothetical protein KOO61_03920 [Spirochaetales bacterium]|nr:hypothetical protein [Spirochaetales bacterium]